MCYTSIETLKLKEGFKKPNKSLAGKDPFTSELPLSHHTHAPFTTLTSVARAVPSDRPSCLSKTMAYQHETEGHAGFRGLTPKSKQLNEE